MVWRKEIHIAGRDAEERPLQLEAITLKGKRLKFPRNWPGMMADF